MTLKGYIGIIISLLMIYSCSKPGIISKKTMSEIYYDIYITDQNILNNPPLRGIPDTILVYEPIFNKYGYTFTEYSNSVKYYLQRPDQFLLIFEKTKKMLENRKVELTHLVKLDSINSANKILLDTLFMYADDSIISNNYYRTIKALLKAPDTVSYSLIIDSSLFYYTRKINHLYDSIPPFVTDTSIRFNTSLPLRRPTTKNDSIKLDKPMEKILKK